jgi:predicted nucleotidyltransferase component of viral defense system
MAAEIRNIPASVHQRLLAKARDSSRPFNELLQHFAIERFLYRLSKSPQAGRFILKGALMLSAWSGYMSRPTMDIDLSGKIENDPATLADAMKEACRMAVLPDGMFFDAGTVTAARIMEDAGYPGVRVRIQGNLGNARVSLQIDVGFGDVIIPGPRKITYPVLLDFPPPELNGYSMESTIAEKFHAMVQRGVLNSRMKDFHDVWMLSRTFDFQGAVLAEAIEKTFANRDTEVPADPAVFAPSFAAERDKIAQWRGFIRKSGLSGAPGSFTDAVAAIRKFLEPVAVALSEQGKFHGTWKAPGPWC